MLKPSLQLKLGQSLTMTPQLQQAIRLLQLPTIELEAHVRQVLESNVMLEADEESELTGTFEIPGTAPAGGSAAPSGDADSRELRDEPPEVEIIEQSYADRGAGSGGDGASGAADDEGRQAELPASRALTLHEHLLEQLELAGLNQRDLAIASGIVDAINDDGYVTDPLAEIAATLAAQGLAVTEQEVERVLALVQYLDPAGVGARSLAECIGLQLNQLDPRTPGLEVAHRIAAAHLDLVAARQYGQLRKTLGVSEEQLHEALALVRACNPRPGSVVGGGTAEYVVPDVFVRRTDRGWSVELNSATLPRVRINQSYVNLIGRNGDHALLRAQLQEARWLLKSLEIRNETLLKVARTIVQRQVDFLEHGEEHMRPMILRDVAEAIAMHESTVSRVTANKYMHTPRGVYELRYFFSSHVDAADGVGATSSTAIRAKIRKLIKEEDPQAPLSDSRLAELLSSEGIPVARRTVAKYREALGIPSSNDRKKVPTR
ncbi:MAG: RNA polymerase factor sigma-54 [Steroidobacteraceae bacterium]|nr:RNA polymerase factor sigma-54 [Steroidobacteraceae bacterium]MDW8257911.1 RNA polymerase factor sigma-54 [Gammaproteobacteria bacterium]